MHLLSDSNGRITNLCPYLVVKNSISLLVFSFILLEATSSSTSCEISGRLLLLPPKLKLDDVDEELKPESGPGDAWHSRRKSKPPEHITETGVWLQTSYSGIYFMNVWFHIPNCNFKLQMDLASARRKDAVVSTWLVLKHFHGCRSSSSYYYCCKANHSFVINKKPNLCVRNHILHMNITRI